MGCTGRLARSFIRIRTHVRASSMCVRSLKTALMGSCINGGRLVEIFTGNQNAAIKRSRRVCADQGNLNLTAAAHGQTARFRATPSFVKTCSGPYLWPASLLHAPGRAPRQRLLFDVSHCHKGSGANFPQPIKQAWLKPCSAREVCLKRREPKLRCCPVPVVLCQSS